MAPRAPAATTPWRIARRWRIAPIVASTAAALLVSACAVGPNFNSPAPPGVRDYTPEPPAATASAPGVAGGQAQAFAYGSDIAGDWWTVFHSPEITALVQQALSANHDLKAAQAALAAAHEITLAQRGSFYPQVTASYSATRQRTSGALAPIPADNSTQFNLFTPQVSVAYALDVFGLNRRTAESARAQEQSVHFQLVAAHLTLTS
ncbi:TolC family protein, partial [Phenylobacterium sp.]|uniref:TolC family protein n=1 Tax=Phenylobacterium sp. TaxID=1871053 RepID=UPI002F41B41B